MLKKNYLRKITLGVVDIFKVVKNKIGFCEFMLVNNKHVPECHVCQYWKLERMKMLKVLNSAKLHVDLGPDHVQVFLRHKCF